MPNRMYEKGRRKEQAWVRRLKGAGCVAFRSAGSKSPIDVIGINPFTSEITLIQCKGPKMTDAARDKLLSTLKYLEGDYFVTVKVV